MLFFVEIPMPPDSPIVLIIEDESAIRKSVAASLNLQGYRTMEADSGKTGVMSAHSQPPDVILLDLGLPDMDGIEVVRQIREWTKIPIIVVSARGQSADKVAALDLGSNDYLTKPFDIDELLARIRVALRSAATAGTRDNESVYISGDLKVDLVARRVFVQDRETHLTPIEYRLLVTLLQNAEKVLTHAFILKAVWGPPHMQDTQYLRVFMTSLRRKIEVDSARPRYIITEPGIGYRFAEVTVKPADPVAPPKE